MEINKNQNFNHISMSSIEPVDSKKHKKGKLCINLEANLFYYSNLKKKFYCQNFNKYI
jgi:hypothetical protein